MRNKLPQALRRWLRNGVPSALSVGHHTAQRFSDLQNGLHFRQEEISFNILNHPNFGSPISFLTSPNSSSWEQPVSLSCLLETSRVCSYQPASRMRMSKSGLC